MIYLTDNDIVEKLAVCDLLDDALGSFGATRSEVRVIPTLVHRIGGKARARAERRLGTAAVARILTFLEDVQPIHQKPSLEDLQILDDVVGIDAGETILLAAAGHHPDFLLLTGDKRCIKTLCTTAKCEPLALRVRGRVVCFEQVIRRLIEQLGFEYVLEKVVPIMFDHDLAIRAAFGSGSACTELNTLGCLHSYIDELRRLPIDLLFSGYKREQRCMFRLQSSSDRRWWDKPGLDNQEPSPRAHRPSLKIIDPPARNVSEPVVLSLLVNLL